MSTNLYFIMLAGVVATSVDGTIWDAADVAVSAAKSGGSEISILRVAGHKTVAILDGLVVQPTADLSDAEIGI